MPVHYLVCTLKSDAKTLGSPVFLSIEMSSPSSRLTDIFCCSSTSTMANNWNQQWHAGGGSQSTSLLNHGASGAAATAADYQAYSGASAAAGAEGSQVIVLSLFLRVHVSFMFIQGSSF